MGGGAVFVAEAENSKAGAPGLEPFVGRDSVAKVIAESELPVRFRFNVLPAPFGVELTGRGINADSSDQSRGRVAEERNGPLRRGPSVVGELALAGFPIAMDFVEEAGDFVGRGHVSAGVWRRACGRLWRGSGCRARAGRLGRGG